VLGRGLESCERESRGVVRWTRAKMSLVESKRKLDLYRAVLLAAGALGLLACPTGAPVPPERASAAIAAAPPPSTARFDSSRFPPVSPAPSAEAPSAKARWTHACEEALRDHVAFYGDVDRPPPLAKQQVFTELCLALPPLFQRCASPAYLVDHEEECRPVHAAKDERQRLWAELFEALREVP
jgi:hypothetical protein